VWSTSASMTCRCGQPTSWQRQAGSVLGEYVSLSQRDALRLGRSRGSGLSGMTLHVDGFPAVARQDDHQRDHVQAVNNWNWTLTVSEKEHARGANTGAGQDVKDVLLGQVQYTKFSAHSQ